MSPLLWILLILFFVQCGYALYFFARIYSIPLAGLSTRSQPFLPVSIILCARNEAENLRKNLPGILAQRYGNDSSGILYEVIVVNDCSTDDTGHVLSEFQIVNRHLKVVTVTLDMKRVFPGKKFPLSLGVATAANSHFLFTDADCQPAGPDWLAHMALPFSDGKEIVIGYSGFYRRKGLLQAFIQWETMHTFLQYATYARSGRPYMAVGRNLGATRDAYVRATKHPAWTQIPSGDDDLLIQAAATTDNVAVIIHPDAFTYSPPQNDWASWWRQKQRHVSTGKYYQPLTQQMLGAYALSHGLFWLFLFASLMFATRWMAVGILLLRVVTLYPIWYAACRRLRIEQLIPWFLFCDWAWSAYNFALAPYHFWKNKQQWK